MDSSKKLTLQLDVTDKLWELVDVLLAVDNAEDAMSSSVYDWWAEHGNTMITVQSHSSNKSLSETVSDVSDVWMCVLDQLVAIDHPRKRDVEVAWEKMHNWCTINDIAEGMEDIAVDEKM